MLGALATLLLLAAAPSATSGLVKSLAPADSLIRPGETHFAHLWRVSFEGDNACPRWSPSGDALVYEYSAGSCPQVFVWKPGHHGLLVSYDTGDLAMSPAFLGRDDVFVFSATRISPDSCRSSARRWRDAKWPLYPSSLVFVRAQGILRAVTKEAGAIESATSPDGKKILYSAAPAKDVELYAMDPDGSNVVRLTADYGYDGGGCFSPDGKMICYQAYHPRLEDEKAMYADLLAKHLVDSSLLDVWVMHADGSGRGQVTDLGATSMEPSFTPDSKRIIFSSDYKDPQGRQFDLYITKLDGGTPEKITNDPSPDCFPMFSPDGRYLAFTSGRGASTAGAQNVFIAEWK